MALTREQCWQRAVARHGGNGLAVLLTYRALLYENGLSWEWTASTRSSETIPDDRLRSS